MKDHEYQRLEQELTAKYQQDRDRISQSREEAVAAAQAVIEEMNAAVKTHQDCQLAYEEAQRLQTEASAERERLTQACDDLRRTRENDLRSAAEEKLRLLGAKTIERIDAEDEVARASADCQAKRARCLVAEQRAAEIKKTIQLEEEKLERIREECEQALLVARTKTSIFA